MTLGSFFTSLRFASPICKMAMIVSSTWAKSHRARDSGGAVLKTRRFFSISFFFLHFSSSSFLSFLLFFLFPLFSSSSSSFGFSILSSSYQSSWGCWAFLLGSWCLLHNISRKRRQTRRWLATSPRRRLSLGHLGHCYRGAELGVCRKSHFSIRNIPRPSGFPG